VVRGRLGLSDHEMIEFLVHGEVKRGAQQNHHHGLPEGRLWPVQERVPWERVLKGKGVQAGWAFFKEEVLKAQEQAVPMCRKTNQLGR